LEVDPELAEAHASRGLALSAVERYDEAEQELRTAMQLDDSLFESHYFFGWTCKAQGKHAAAATAFERAHEIRPDTYRCAILLGQAYQALGRDREAKDMLRRGVAAAEAALVRRPENVDAAALGAGALAYLGQAARAREWATLALSLEPDDIVAQYNVACSYAVIGEVEAAIDVLERVLPPQRGMFRTEALHDRDLDSLRSHPRFQALLARTMG
jgi:adenylate cyclase